MSISLSYAGQEPPGPGKRPVTSISVWLAHGSEGDCEARPRTPAGHASRISGEPGMLMCERKGG